MKVVFLKTQDDGSQTEVGTIEVVGDKVTSDMADHFVKEVLGTPVRRGWAKTKEEALAMAPQRYSGGYLRAGIVDD